MCCRKAADVVRDARQRSGSSYSDEVWFSRRKCAYRRGGRTVQLWSEKKIAMSLILIIVILLLLFGAGGGYYGFRKWGAGGGIGIIGLVLIIILVLYLVGGFH